MESILAWNTPNGRSNNSSSAGSGSVSTCSNIRPSKRQPSSKGGARLRPLHRSCAGRPGSLGPHDQVRPGPRTRRRREDGRPRRRPPPDILDFNLVQRPRRGGKVRCPARRGLRHVPDRRRDGFTRSITELEQPPGPSAPRSMNAVSQRGRGFADHGAFGHRRSLSRRN